MTEPSQKRRRARRALLQHGVAFTWGFAEAMVFFVVPDAWTSAVGLRRPGRAQALTLTATAGAVLGGAVVHRWSARTDPARSATLAARIPAISSTMVAKVDAQMGTRGFSALMIGRSPAPRTSSTPARPQRRACLSAGSFSGLSPPG